MAKRKTNKPLSLHTFWMKAIKKTLGKKCTHIIHVKDKEEYYIEVRLKNEQEGTDTIRYKIKGTPNDLTPDDYNSLLTNLKEGLYEQGS